MYLTETIAYFNLGASYEHINKMEKAIKSYQIALEIGKLKLGENHALTQTITDNLNKAREKEKYF